MYIWTCLLYFFCPFLLVQKRTEKGHPRSRFSNHDPWFSNCARCLKCYAFIWTSGVFNHRPQNHAPRIHNSSCWKLSFVRHYLQGKRPRRGQTSVAPGETRGRKWSILNCPPLDYILKRSKGLHGEGLGGVVNIPACRQDSVFRSSSVRYKKYFCSCV